MSFTIKSEYSNTVERFVWPTSTSSTLVLSAPILNQLVKDVFQQIKSIFDETIVGLSALANKQLSKIETCYIATQNSDVYLKQNTPLQIQNASQQVKDILLHIKNRIAEKALGNEKEIETAVLLVGIHHVDKKMCAAATTSNLFSREELEKSLEKLEAKLCTEQEAVIKTSLEIEDLRTLLALHSGSTTSPVAPTTASSPATPTMTSSPALSTPAKKAE